MSRNSQQPGTDPGTWANVFTYNTTDIQPITFILNIIMIIIQFSLLLVDLPGVGGVCPALFISLNVLKRFIHGPGSWFNGVGRWMDSERERGGAGPEK